MNNMITGIDYLTLPPEGQDLYHWDSSLELYVLNNSDQYKFTSQFEDLEFD